MNSSNIKNSSKTKEKDHSDERGLKGLFGSFRDPNATSIFRFFNPMDTRIKNLTLEKYIALRFWSIVISLFIIQLLYIGSYYDSFFQIRFLSDDLIDFFLGIILSSVIYYLVYSILRFVIQRFWIAKNRDKAYIAGNWCHYYTRNNDNTDDYVRGGWIEINQNFYDIEVKGHNFNIEYSERKQDIIIDPAISSTWSLKASDLDKDGNVVGCFIKDTNNTDRGKEDSPEVNCHGIITFSNDGNFDNNIRLKLKGTTADTGRSTVNGKIHLFRTPKSIADHTKLKEKSSPEWIKEIKREFKNKLKFDIYNYFAFYLDDSDYKVTIPDLNYLTVKGNTLDEAISKITEEGNKLLSEILINSHKTKDNDFIPKSSDLSTFVKKVPEGSKILTITFDVKEYIQQKDLDFSHIKNADHEYIKETIDQEQPEKIGTKDISSKFNRLKDKIKLWIFPMNENPRQMTLYKIKKWIYPMDSTVENATVTKYKEINDLALAIFLGLLQFLNLRWLNGHSPYLSFYFDPITVSNFVIGYIFSALLFTLIYFIIRFGVQKIWIYQNRDDSYIAGDWFHFYSRKEDAKENYIRGGWISISQNFYDIDVEGHNFNINYNNKDLFIKPNPVRSTWKFETSEIDEKGNVIGSFKKRSKVVDKNKEDSPEVDCYGIISFDGKAYDKYGIIQQLYGKTADAGASTVSGGLTLFRSPKRIKLTKDEYPELINLAPELWREEVRKQFQNKINVGELYYYGYVFTNKEGNYQINVPDLEGVHGFGDSITNAVLDAQYQATEAIVNLLKQPKNPKDNSVKRIPRARTINELDINNKTVVRLKLNIDKYIKEREDGFLNLPREEIFERLKYVID